MKTLEIHVPDDIDLAVGASPEELEALACKTLALHLFRSGKLTSGQAAEIAGVPRRTFLLELSSHGIPAVSWDQEELEAEATSISQSP